MTNQELIEITRRRVNSLGTWPADLKLFLQLADALESALMENRMSQERLEKCAYRIEQDAKRIEAAEAVCEVADVFLHDFLHQKTCVPGALQRNRQDAVSIVGTKCPISGIPKSTRTFGGKP